MSRPECEKLLRGQMEKIQSQTKNKATKIAHKTMNLSKYGSNTGGKSDFLLAVSKNRVINNYVRIIQDTRRTVGRIQNNIESAVNDIISKEFERKRISDKMEKISENSNLSPYEKDGCLKKLREKREEIKKDIFNLIVQVPVATEYAGRWLDNLERIQKDSEKRFKKYKKLYYGLNKKSSMGMSNYIEDGLKEQNKIIFTMMKSFKHLSITADDILKKMRMNLKSLSEKYQGITTEKESVLHSSLFAEKRRRSVNFDIDEKEKIHEIPEIPRRVDKQR